MTTCRGTPRLKGSGSLNRCCSTMRLYFFATFFSSATALLPIFAEDTSRLARKVTGGCTWRWRSARSAHQRGDGPWSTSHRAPRRGAVVGVVAGGLATVVFGLSRSGFWLTFVCLAFTGADGHGQHGFGTSCGSSKPRIGCAGRMTGVKMESSLSAARSCGELEGARSPTGSAPGPGRLRRPRPVLLLTGWLAAATPALRHYRAEEWGGAPRSHATRRELA